MSKTPSFTVERVALMAELAHAEKAGDKKVTVPILGHVLLEATGDKLTLKATDLDVSFESQVDAGVAREGAVALPTKRLQQVVATLPGDVTIEGLEDAWVGIRSGKVSGKLAGLPAEDFPRLPTGLPTQFELPAEPLLRGIVQTRYAISSGAVERYSIQGAQLRIGAGVLEMAATDGHRLSHYTEQCEAGAEIEVMVPIKALDEIVRLAKNLATVGFGQDEHHIVFRLGGRTLAHRKIEGQFPSVKRVLDAKHDSEAAASKEALVAALKRALTVARSAVVALDSYDSRLVVSAESAEGAIEDELALEGGQRVHIGFNARYLLDMLDTIDSEKVRIFMKSHEHAGYFLPFTEGPGRSTHVVMPCRLGDEDEASKDQAREETTA